ncbi:MAG: hypothetical protein QXX35_03275 [Desulfurococcaceae archaeon]|uniref:Uncharacterized protein n=1 Tax=Staphylothermus marinus TaxID=2280 RepID=A0A7C4DAI0_STAMA
MIFQLINFETIILIIVLTILLLLLTTYSELKRKPRKPEYETKEILECTKCRHRVLEDFEPGDFISMYKNKCPKCGGLMKVKAIYCIEKTLKY